MFSNREEAGEQLAAKLQSYKDTKSVVVLGIPRGGVVTALVVAKRLQASFDVVVVKKISSLQNPELAIGAVGLGKNNKPIVKYTSEQITRHVIQEGIERGLQLVKEREEMIRHVLPEESLENKTAIIVDDGVATGATVVCAASVVRSKGAKKVVLATPVIAQGTYKEIRRDFNDIVALDIPTIFYAVGQFYREFPQVSDEGMMEQLTLLHSMI